MPPHRRRTSMPADRRTREPAIRQPAHRSASNSAPVHRAPAIRCSARRSGARTTGVRWRCTHVHIARRSHATQSAGRPSAPIVSGEVGPAGRGLRPASASHVATTVSGLSDMLSIPAPPATARDRGGRTGPARRCRRNLPARWHASIAIDSIALTASSRSSNVAAMAPPASRSRPSVNCVMSFEPIEKPSKCSRNDRRASHSRESRTS